MTGTQEKKGPMTKTTQVSAATSTATAAPAAPASAAAPVQATVETAAQAALRDRGKKSNPQSMNEVETAQKKTREKPAEKDQNSDKKGINERTVKRWLHQCSKLLRNY